ncbi:MAG TPA: hypothetical protein PLQ93_12385 [Bacteroidia bacterium]|nr:hypothetical protein [Bacteroidia bacterium]
MKTQPCYFALLLGLLFHTGFAQGLYYKSVTEMEGVPAMLAKMSKSTSETWCKKGKLKVLTHTPSVSQTQYMDGKTVTIINSNEPTCVLFSQSALLKDSVFSSVYISKVRVEQSSETRKILGYTCSKTILHYQAAQKENKSATTNCEMWVWSCKDLKLPVEALNKPEILQRNSLSEAMMNIEGFVLCSETIMKDSQMKTVTKVTEIQTRDIPDSEFVPGKGLCENPMGLPEYNAYLIRQSKTPTGWH